MATARGFIWPEPAPSGTLWVDPATGRVYRQREDNTGRYYDSLREEGYHVTQVLPKGAVCVHFPKEGT